MAFTILAKVGEENTAAVIATTITSYAISSVLTGLVFFLMGSFGFGYIVGFIPRHILIGCIGGVGWFLIATGFEVTARLDGNLNYSGLMDHPISSCALSLLVTNKDPFQVLSAHIHLGNSSGLLLLRAIPR
jgi:MFS superfamily sulfate permease-like transporter